MTNGTKYKILHLPTSHYIEWKTDEFSDKYGKIFVCDEEGLRLFIHAYVNSDLKRITNDITYDGPLYVSDLQTIEVSEEEINFNDQLKEWD